MKSCIWYNFDLTHLASSPNNISSIIKMVWADSISPFYAQRRCPSQIYGFFLSFFLSCPSSMSYKGNHSSCLYIADAVILGYFQCGRGGLNRTRNSILPALCKLSSPVFLGAAPCKWSPPSFLYCRLCPFFISYKFFSSPLPCQVYKDRHVVAQLVRRAERAGFKAIALTVDTPRLGRREADIKNR